MAIEVIESYVLSRVGDFYESKIRVWIGGRQYGVRRQHPTIMVEGTYATRDAQESYVLYDMVQELKNLIGNEIMGEVQKKLRG